MAGMFATGPWCVTSKVTYIKQLKNLYTPRHLENDKKKKSQIATSIRNKKKYIYDINKRKTKLEVTKKVKNSKKMAVSSRASSLLPPLHNHIFSDQFKEKGWGKKIVGRLSNVCSEISALITNNMQVESGGVGWSSHVLAKSAVFLSSYEHWSLFDIYF